MSEEREPEEVASGTERAPGPARALTSLIGRDDTLVALGALQRRTRLLTLVGPGGCGKSRLGLALLDVRRAAYPGGVWAIGLADVHAAFVPQTVALSVGVIQRSVAPLVETLARHLRGPPRLLFLDDCEQVATSCATLVAGLLERCPDLDVVATSRTPLGVPGEQLWRVAGLPVSATDPETAAHSPAVELFVQRATLAAPSFSATEALPEIARICESLDGIPLAIELAAAKTAMLSVEEIAARLERDSGFLRSGSSTVPGRHRSLAATLEWSFRLLTASEQILLRRLSVFAGSFSLAGAEAVCAGTGIDAGDVLDLLARLVDQSLVQVDESDPESRYRLLATVRQYAARELSASGEATAVAERHASFCAALAADADAQAPDGDARLDLEQENLRAALDTWLPDNPESAGRLLGSLWPFWCRRGFYREARRWLELALAEAARMSADVRAEVLTGAGVLAFLQCDYTVAAERLQAALDLEQELDDRRGVARTLQRLGSIAREQGRYDDARRLHQRSQSVWAGLGELIEIAVSDDYIAFAAWLAGDVATAAELSGRALETFQRGERPHEIASALINLGAAALYRGDLQAASDHLEDALALSRQLGYREGVAWALNELGILWRRRHHPARAAELLRESLLVHQELGDRWRMASVLEEIAIALLARIDPRAAARTLGAADALRDALGAPVPPVERTDRDWAVNTVRRRLGTAVFTAAWDEGVALGVDSAVDAALSAIDRLYASTLGAEEGRHPPLTERERDVLRLVAEGRTNREIGDALYISASTAGVHVSNILRKLGAASRAQAAALAHEGNLLPDSEQAPSAAGNGR